MRRPSLRIAIVGVLVVLLVGSAAAYVAWGRATDARAERAIRSYDDALSLALKELDPERISIVSTESNTSVVASYITYLWGSGVYMEATLSSLELVSVDRDGDTWDVVVTEEWRYQKRDRTSGETVGGGTREQQTVRYTLVPGGGRLLVDRVEVLDQ